MKYLLVLLLAGCAAPDYCVEENWQGRCVSWQINASQSKVRGFK